MADLVSNLNLISPSQGSKEATADTLFNSMWIASFFGIKSLVGLSLSIYAANVLSGGVSTRVADTALTLTDNATNYVEQTGTSAPTFNTSGFTGGRSPLYQITFVSGSVTALTDKRVAAIGTTFSGGTLTAALNEAGAVTLASAGTVNIGAAAANTINVTGTTTITAFDAIAASAVRRLIFAGALTLTYNATSLILPTAANITTAAGDVVEFVSLGSGNWRCINYERASGQALSGSSFTGGTLTSALNEAPIATLASAGTLNIGAAAANTISVTGTTSVTAFDTIAAGAVRRLAFTGILTLTYNAVSLILPSAANITTAAGDLAEFVSLGSGNWRCVNYERASGAALVSSSFTGGTLTTAINEAPVVTLASASTVNIGAAAGNSISITGTTTITAFDTIAAGARRLLTFAGALTLTHNGTSLILPGAANITTVAGDVGEFISLGSGNWRCIDYTPSTATPGTFVPRVVTVSFSATPSINLSAGDAFLITATGNITGMTFTGGTDFKQVRIRILQDGTGGRGVVLDSTAIFSSDLPSFTPSSAPNALDELVVERNDVKGKYQVMAYNRGF